MASLEGIVVAFRSGRASAKVSISNALVHSRVFYQVANLESKPFFRGFFHSG